MKTENLAKLEDEISDWINDIAGNDMNEYQGYYHDELATQMAKAAEQVFDATFMAQKFAKEQGK